MSVVVVVVLALAGALALYLLLERTGRAGVPLAVLRAASWSAIAILLVDPACHRRGDNSAVVLLDGSASMSDPGGDGRWRAAVDSARAFAGGTGRVFLFGGEPRVFQPAMRPDGPESRLAPSLREAAARGGPLVIVTDGLIDDPEALPADVLRRARIVVLPRAVRPDAGVAVLDIPVALRAGDTASAGVDLAVQGAAPGDSATLELFEAGRLVARTRLALQSGGSIRRSLTFVPAPTRAASEVRRYEARLSGFARDGEPRDDRLGSAASVSRASAIVLLSDSPDWDFRWLARTLATQSGVPVHAFVRLGATGWRESRTMRPVSDQTVRAEASDAALVVAHGTEAGVAANRRLAHRAVFEWITSQQADAPAADWYVTSPEFASPVGGALAGVPAESLPPLEAVLDVHPDSVSWTGLVAQVDRRGRSRPVVVGAVTGGRRTAVVGASGLWRWASRGGVAEQAYRALMASLTDWLMEERTGAPADLALLRDSLARTSAEFLPRRPALAAQPGLGAAEAGEAVPVRFSPWLYFAAIVALLAEWIGRRRRGLR
ncbi:MAG: vWA domain-containing protein [Gemmatimonadales bacterium]